MKEEEIEKVLLEYCSFLGEDVPRGFIGNSRRIFPEIERFGKSRWRGRIREEIFFGTDFGTYCPGPNSVLMSYVDWTSQRTRRGVLRNLLKELSGGKSPEEASLELTSLGRNGTI